MNKLFILLICGLFILSLAPARAQTLLTKEAMNNFAQYMKTNDLKKLELARAKIDEAYKSKSDSIAFRNNLIRGLVYSTFAYIDSNLKFTYKKDPLEEVILSMNKVYGSKNERQNRDKINYIESQLKQIYLFRANSALKSGKLTEALKYFKILEPLDRSNISIIHNLSLISQELGQYPQAISYYEKLITFRSRPEYYLVVANLYELLNDDFSVVRVLKAGANRFINNRDILFKLINTLQNRNDYSEISNYIAPAIALDQENINLIYLAGFSHEMLGNIIKAEQYYKLILEINPNNYDANYSLGLLYLNLYLRDKKQDKIKYVAKSYLLKANEISPNELKLLNSLAIFLKNSGEISELQKINNRINQLKLN